MWAWVGVCWRASVVALAPALAAAQAPPAADTAGIAAREIAYLEFIAAAPLAAAERQRVAADTEAALRTASARMAARDRVLARSLASVARLKPHQAEAYRAASRLSLATVVPADIEPLASTERRVVGAHDPVVVYDAAGKRLVTERSLSLLRDAAAWTAREVGLPGPDATFIDKARQGIRARFRQLDPSVADGFAHVGQYGHDEPYVLAMLKPPRLAAFKQRSHADLAALPPGTDRQWWLATYTAGIVQNVEGVRKTMQLQAMVMTQLPALNMMRDMTTNSMRQGLGLGQLPLTIHP